LLSFVYLLFQWVDRWAGHRFLHSRMFDFHPSVTKGRIGRVGLRSRVAFGSAPAAHSPLLPLGCSNQVRSLFGK
jgi:hypothetical protein